MGCFEISESGVAKNVGWIWALGYCRSVSCAACCKRVSSKSRMQAVIVLMYGTSTKHTKHIVVKRIMPTKGRTNKLEIKNSKGNVPKRQTTIGRVKSCADMVVEAVFATEVKCLFTYLSIHLSESGLQTTIPKTAR